MKMNELMSKVLEILPNATFGEDNDGQLIIYTDLKLEKMDELVPIGE